MGQVTFKGDPVKTVGLLPAKGAQAPAFQLVGTDLSEVKLADFSGKRVVLNIFLSLDTSVCEASVKRFNTAVSELDNTVVLCISVDLPFAQARFCGAEGLENVKMLSGFRDHNFGTDYGVRIEGGALAGLFSRAVVVLDESGVVLHAELVPEITQEPDYEAALAVL